MSERVQHHRMARNQRPGTTRYKNALVIQDDMAVINGIIIKGRHVIIPYILGTQALEQLHINHMGIEKSILWHMNLYTGLI